MIRQLTDDKPHILIVEARFYDDLLDACSRAPSASLDQARATYEIVSVPGAFEIPGPASSRIGRQCRPAGAPVRRLRRARLRHPRRDHALRHRLRRRARAALMDLTRPVRAGASATASSRSRTRRRPGRGRGPDDARTRAAEAAQACLAMVGAEAAPADGSQTVNALDIDAAPDKTRGINTRRAPGWPRCRRSIRWRIDRRRRGAVIREFRQPPARQQMGPQDVAAAADDAVRTTRAGRRRHATSSTT